MRESFLITISIFIVLFLTAGQIFLTYKNNFLEKQCKSCESYLDDDENQDKGFFINFISKKDKEGNPIWMIVVGIFFILFLIIRIILFLK